jgi:hypothetical protein
MFKHMSRFRVIFTFLLFASYSASNAQVLLEDFNRADNASVGGGWTEVENYSPAAADLTSNSLELISSKSKPGSGRLYIYQDVSSNYSTTLSNNPCIMTWAFNISQDQTTCNGFNLNNFAAAFILGSTTNNFETSGNGYAVAIGGNTAGTQNKLRLIKFQGGLGMDANVSDIITPITLPGLNGHYSIIVNYNPSGNKWQLFYRNDGTSFADPAPLSGTGTYTASFTAADNTYTGSSLNYLGCFWNFNSSPKGAIALFDNIYIPTSGTATIAAGGPTTFCTGGSVTLTASTGYNYLWSNGATTQTITVTSGASYSVTITDVNGCQRTSAATAVTVNSLPSTPTITASGPVNFCTGSSVNLTSSSAASNLWSTGAVTQTITVNSSGVYTVKVTDGNGCTATSSPTVVTVNTPAPVITASGPTTFCQGGSVNLTSTSASSYLWSNGATTQTINVTSSGSYSVIITNAIGCQNTSVATVVTVNPLPAVPVITANGSTILCSGGSVKLTSSAGSSSVWSTGTTKAFINVSSAGSYTASITNANGCTSTSTPKVVSVNPVPTITAGGPVTFCSGGSVNLTSSAATSYLWSNGATTQTISVNASGSYSVAANYGGCSNTSATKVVTVNALPSVPAITAGGLTTFCSGGSVNLTSDPATSYLWSNGATTQTISATTSGSYTVTVSNASGCTRTSAATAVTVNSLPAIPVITPGGTTTFCTGGSVNLTSDAATSYLWSNGATTQTISVNASGSYAVTVTNANGCQASSVATSVTVNSLPSVPAITAGGTTTFCAGGSVNLTSDAATSYLWSNGATTQTISVNASGSYAVTVTNANGCQASSDATSVNVNSLPSVPAITAAGTTTFCAGGSVNLTSDAATSYLWSNGATTQTISVNASGSYTVTVTNANGCQASSVATSVNVNSLPSVPAITAGGTTTFCAGGSVNLTSDAATSYLWSNGATTQTISVNASGPYAVTVTNANGCQASSAATSVTVNSLPVATITSNGPVTFCSFGSVDLSAPAASSFLWSNAAITQTIHVNTPGSYTVTITDANGCQATSAATLVTTNSCSFIWTGALSSDWNTSGNWNTGFVPAAYDDVTIPSGTLNKAIITGSIAYRTLTINTGATFQVNSGAVLNTSGDFIKNGTYTDNGGTVLFNGTSVQNIIGAVNFSNVVVNNTSGVVLNNPTSISGILSLLNGQLYSNGNLNMDLNTGEIAYNASDNGGISGNMTVSKNITAIKTHYLSSPLNGSVSGDFYDDDQVINPSTGLTRLFSWDLPTQAWVAMYGTSTPLPPLSGYSLYFTLTSVLDFTGTYSHKNVPTPISYTNAPAGASIMVGNPYPSALDWNMASGWTKNNVNNAIYLWDGKNSRYASYVNGLGVNGGTQYIPSMQGFYVVTAVAGDASIGVNNQARITNPNPKLWRQGTIANAIKLSLSSGSYNDETIIRFSENASDGFDGQMDALKFKNIDLAPSFYSVSGDKEYSINTLGSQPVKIIPLNVEPGFSGTYTITNEELGSFDSEYSLILEDKLLHTFTDLKTSGYTFSINPDQGKNRFSLVYRTADQGTNQNLNGTSVNIGSDGENIKVSYSNLDNAQASFSLYNTLGQLITSATFETASGEYMNTPINTPPGIYIVKVMAGNKLYSSKILLSE